MRTGGTILFMYSILAIRDFAIKGDTGMLQWPWGCFSSIVKRLYVLNLPTNCIQAAI
jgi:hypothetical protein